MHKVDIQKLKELDLDRLFDNLIDKEVTYLNLIDLIKHFTGFENIRLKALYDDILDYLAEHDKVVDACSYQFGSVFIEKHKFETIYKLWELTNKYLDNKPHLQKQTNKNPLESLARNIYLLEDLELYPDVKYNLIEILDEVRNCYSESLMEANKGDLTKNLYLSKKPNIFYMRELDRVLNLLNARIFRIRTELKKYPNYKMEVHSRTHTILKHFDIAIIYFNPFYELAKSRMQEIKKLKRVIPKPIEHPFKEEKTFELFNYIVDNWKYKANQKWADIFNAIKYNNNGKEPTYKNEYRAYIIKRFQYTGKFQFDYEKKSTNRHKQDLIKLIEKFSKK